MNKFKEIPWFNWKYQINNIWDIKTFNYNKTWQERLLKSKKEANWYMRIWLYIQWKRKFYNIHRLILLTFIWPSKLQVNHKNWVRDDNRLENLEYCTMSENMKHSYRKLGRNVVKSALWKFWKNNPSSKKINQFNKDWNFIKKWSSIIEVQTELLINKSNIWQCCKWKLKSAWWYKWKYAES